MKESREPKGLNIGPWIRRLLLAWILGAGLEFFALPDAVQTLEGLDALAQMSPARMGITTAVIFLMVCVISGLLRKEPVERWLIAAGFLALMTVSLMANFTWAFGAVCLLVLTVLILYGLHGWDDSTKVWTVCTEKPGLYGWLTALGTLAFFGIVSIWTVSRIYSFNTPTFDFGIFAQMFHSMRTTGLPITTVERDGPLSHFAVHVSPIYYLLLPFYCLVPIPATLQVLQAAVLAGAVIPLWKIGKQHGLSPLLRMLVCFLLLLNPAYAGGTSYDIHENAFLTPLILWLLYGIDRRNGLITAVAGVLTLMVKEDAAVYVAVIALYLLLRTVLKEKNRWDLTVGCLLLGGALLWFGAVTAYLSGSGDGVMTYRYDNFIYDDSDSLVTVIKAVLLCPMKAVFECVDAEKLEFIGLTLLPLAGLPLITRRYERYVLLIPYILVNLMSDYQYQHDIFFQYTYGSMGCLIYLAAVNLADLTLHWQRLAACGAALFIALSCFSAQILPKAFRYPSYCVTYQDYYDDLREVLDTVPDGVSVAATTFFTTELSQRDVLYDIRYASKEHTFGCEYMAINPADAKSFKKYAQTTETGYEEFVQLLTEQGYERIAEHEGKLEIYRRQ